MKQTLSLYKIQNIPIETGFILILKTRIAKLKGQRARCFILSRMQQHLKDTDNMKLMENMSMAAQLVYFLNHIITQSNSGPGLIQDRSYIHISAENSTLIMKNLHP